MADLICCGEETPGTFMFANKKEWGEIKGLTH